MKPLKKSILLSLVAPLLFSLLSFTNAVAEGGSLVTIKVYETCKICGGSAKIQVIEEGKSRFIELEKYDAKAPEQNKNAETIHNLLEQYYKAGYKIGGTNGAGALTTYILTK